MQIVQRNILKHQLAGFLLVAVQSFSALSFENNTNALLPSQNIPKEYSGFIKKAKAFYKSGDYEKSAYSYSSAFKSNGWKGSYEDRYNAACAWTLAKKPDSAFFNLNRLSIAFHTIGKMILSDPDFNSIHNDKRWQILVKKIKHARDSAEANFNKPLARKLDSIYDEDQKYRLLIDEIDQKTLMSNEWKKKQKDSISKIIRVKDILNLMQVRSILDKYGWPGPDEIGESGSSALFLVIQHSDLTTQEKYLPLMREAVKNKKAYPSDLALLEDRVALWQGKKQIYGSQVESNDGIANQLSPLDNPDSVDIRRAKVGLEPLSEYLEHFNIKWDVEEYKANMKKAEEKEKLRNTKPNFNKVYFLSTGTVLLLIFIIAILKRKKIE